MKILKYSLMIAVVTVASYTAYSSQSVLNMSDVTLENVEALAGGEIIIPYICGGNDFNCYDPEVHSWYDGHYLA